VGFFYKTQLFSHCRRARTPLFLFCQGASLSFPEGVRPFFLGKRLVFSPLGPPKIFFFLCKTELLFPPSDRMKVVQNARSRFSPLPLRKPLSCLFLDEGTVFFSCQGKEASGQISSSLFVRSFWPLLVEFFFSRLTEACLFPPHAFLLCPCLSIIPDLFFPPNLYDLFFPPWE